MIVLKAALLCASLIVVTPAKADIVDELTNTPLSRFDFGMYRLGKALDEVEERVFRNVHFQVGSFERLHIIARYRAELRRVVIRFDFRIDPNIRLRSDLCERTLVASRDGAYLNNKGWVAHYFTSYTERPSDRLKEETDDMILLKATIHKWVKTNGGGRRVVLAECTLDL